MGEAMKSQPSRMDIANALCEVLAFIVLLAGAFVIVFVLQKWRGDVEPEVLQLKDYDDIPLMTEQEKEWAKETGVASYTVNGDMYVDYSLPSEYWEN